MMRKLPLACVTLVALALVLSAAAWSTAPAALILSCSGNVTVLRKGGAVDKGAYGLSLNAGDEVRTGPGAAAEIHFENGTWITIGAASSLQIRASAAKKPAAVSPAERSNSFEPVQNFLKLRDAEGVGTLAALRSAGKASEIRLESPCQTAVRGGHPAFAWSAADSTTELRLKLYGENGVLWQRDVTGAETIRHPESEEALAPGISYSWTLETTDPLRFPPLRTQAAFFEILEPEEERELEAAIAGIDRADIPSEPAYRIVRASLYFEHRLFGEAIAETAKALEIDPANRALHAILARLYAETGRTDEAMAEYDKLIEQR